MYANFRRIGARIAVLLGVGLLGATPASANPHVGVHVTAPTVFVAPTPAPRVVVSRPVRPSPYHQWVEGRWEWQLNTWVWIPGYWVAPAPVYRAPARVIYRPVYQAPRPAPRPSPRARVIRY